MIIVDQRSSRSTAVRFIKSNPDINPLLVGVGLLFAALVTLLVIILIYSASVIAEPPQTDAQIEDAVETLQDTTAELQETVDELRETVEDTSAAQLQNIDEALTDVNTRLDQIEQNLEAGQVSAASEDTPQDELLTTAGWVVGGLSVLIAVLSGAVLWQRSRQRKRLQLSLTTPVSPRT